MRNSIVSAAIFLLFFTCCNGSNENSIIEEESYMSQDILDKEDSLSRLLQSEVLQAKALLTELNNSLETPLESIDFNNKLIIYISEIHCSTCIDQELDLIQEFYPKEKVILMCNYSSERDLKIYLKVNQIDLHAYIIKSPPSELLVRMTSPTLFTLDPNYKPTCVFFASVSTPERSISYHQEMSAFLDQY